MCGCAAYSGSVGCSSDAVWREARCGVCWFAGQSQLEVSGIAGER